MCGVCAAFAVTRCPRCGQPRCEEHRLADDVRCDACETGFRKLVVRGQRREMSRMIVANLKKPVLGLVGVGVVAGLLVGLLVGWETGAATAAFGLFLTFGIAYFAAFVGVFLIESPEVYAEELREQARRGFLAERKTRELPGPGVRI